MLCALIMAGGKGTRFWPLSTEEKPKQFLNLIGEETMLQMTINRIKEIIPIKQIFVCTGERYKGLIKEQLPELAEKNIIIEPEGRNTAPCVALSTLIINRYYKNSNIVVLPSDHLISNEDKFREIVNSANLELRNNKDTIITLGMKPDRPEIGYGYIKLGDNKTVVNNNEIINVDSFVEKPNLEKAKEYLESKNYLWNGGMFVWNSTYILEEFKKYMPNTYEVLNQIDQIKEELLQSFINENYKKTEAISVDYGILEKTKSISVMPSDIGWDDIGSWEAIERYRKRDENGNIHIGDINSLNGSNNLIVSSNSKVIIDDLTDIYVIENDGKIVVGRKSNISKIKSIKENIKI